MIYTDLKLLRLISLRTSHWKIIDEDSTSSQESGEQMPGVAPQAQNPSNSVSSETSGVIFLNHPFAFRFGFDSVENPSREGFTFGCMPQCNVQLGSSTKRQFRIHYAFKSGALLITADMPILVGGTRLSKSRSLVLMSNTIITYPCEADISFLVEFPDINHCRFAQGELPAVLYEVRRQKNFVSADLHAGANHP